MEQRYKSARRRNVTLGKRDREALNARDVISLRHIGECMEALSELIEQDANGPMELDLDAPLAVASDLVDMWNEVVRIDPTPPQPRREHTAGKTIADFEARIGESGFEFSDYFRFQTPDQLRRLIAGFQMPAFATVGRRKFEMEEVLLVSLTRLSYPKRWADVTERFPNRDRWALKRMFYWFLNFMIDNWGYLLLNNLEWWAPSFGDCASTIRSKLMTLPNVNYRQFHPHPNDDNGFCIFSFIDNTMFAFSRPGGGPVRGGEQSERNDKLIQQAWWTGWKKLHGMKWQTVDLPNGMNLHVWGPVSVRHNDSYTLNKSDIEEKLRALQERLEFQVTYKMFGDSAYFPGEIMAVGGGRGMSSVRETIEWDYKDLKVLWKYCDYRVGLKLFKQPVGKIIFVSLLLRNAHCTMNGNQTAEYFSMQPPSFEDWTSQGRAAHPLPPDCIWSPDYDGGAVDDDDDEEEEEEEEEEEGDEL